MPLYEYACKKCGKHFDKIEKFTGGRVKKCPSCGGRAERIASAPAIQFKGSGWYVTDYAKSGAGGKSSEKNESGGPTEKSEGKKDSKSESKSEGKTPAPAPAKESKENKKTGTKEK